MQRILLGAAVAFVVSSILYGINTTVMAIGLLTICTAGLGLIPMLFGSWLIGAVIIAIGEAVEQATEDRGSDAPQGAAGT